MAYENEQREWLISRSEWAVEALEFKVKMLDVLHPEWSKAKRQVMARHYQRKINRNKEFLAIA